MQKRMTRWWGIGLVLVLAPLLVACQGPPGETGPAGPAGPPGPAGTVIPAFEKPTALEPVVEATYIPIAPAIDGVIDPVWANATELKVPVDGSFLKDVATTGDEVSLKFLYTNTDIYLLAQWADPTMSMARGGSWLWDGTEWYNLSGSAEEMEFGLVAGVSEDRIGVMWDIDVPEFEEKGCLTKCHVEWEGEWVTPTHTERGVCRTCHNADKLVFPGAGAYFDTKDAIADMWHMKAARALPIGYSDDKHVTYDAAPHTGDGGRHGDSGTGFYYHNRNADKTAPLYIETNPKDYVDAMSITQSEIALGEAVAVVGLSTQQINEYWAKYQAITPGVATNFPNAVVPERILKDLAIGLVPRAETGSRSDVLEVAKWSNGKWTAEFARKLVTGHDDDVQFSDFSKVYLFDIALMDNTGGEGHSFHVGTPLHLVFAPPTK